MTSLGFYASPARLLGVHGVFTLVLTALALTASPRVAKATCPASEQILEVLTCSSVLVSNLSSGAGSLGSTSAPYTCGTPYSSLSQNGPEDVYSFTCQQSGTVTMDVSGMDCDVGSATLCRGQSEPR